MNRWFNNFATRASNITGRSYAFVAAFIFVLIWAITGPFFHYSNTWQLIINTSTTVMTFLIVFIIQNSTNRSSNAQQIKLDFILEILGVDDEDARNLENLDDKQLEKILSEVQSGFRREPNASNPSGRDPNPTRR